MEDLVDDTKNENWENGHRRRSDTKVNLPAVGESIQVVKGRSTSPSSLSSSFKVLPPLPNVLQVHLDINKY